MHVDSSSPGVRRELSEPSKGTGNPAKGHSRNGKFYVGLSPSARSKLHQQGERCRPGAVRFDWVGLGLIMMEKTLNVYDFYNLDLIDVSL